MKLKKTVAVFLAMLMLTSSLVACNKGETEETAPSETNISETDASESQYNPNLVTENGVATAHIVLAAGADQSEQYAAEELATHVRLVSGADISVVNTVMGDSLPIVIGTPDSVPELEELFPDDLAWLRDTGDGAEVRWGNDGFAIRRHDGVLYIFGATPRGALNGVYDFIEENMGVLWTRADETIGTVYDEMPTITIEKADYSEKSPFDLRGWTLAGGHDHDTSVMMSRNKLNGLATNPASDTGTFVSMSEIGLEPFISGHNIKWWITSSPSYDPENYEYWSTNIDGTHVAPSASQQVNFWSDVTMQCVADSVLAFLAQNKEAADIDYVGICLEDFDVPAVYPEMEEPFEYAPGQFVNPTDHNYISTVYFSFINKIARIVSETYPDIKIHAYSYAQTIAAPACGVDHNVYATFAPLNEDLCAPIGESQRDTANIHHGYLLDWAEMTQNVQVYNYYGCFTASSFYERPIWDRIQSDLQLYAENGFNGLVPEGLVDIDAPYCVEPVYGIVSEIREPYLNMNNAWSMNAMTFWIYSKLAWNPNEDVNALITTYCDKVYGDASKHMQEYYRLLQIGWTDGRDTMEGEFNCYYLWNFMAPNYWLYFLDVEVDGVSIIEAIQENLNKAYEAANDIQKERLRYIVEVYNNAETLFNH